MPHKPLTPEELAEMVARYQAGETLRALGEHYGGRSAERVRQMIHKATRPDPRHTYPKNDIRWFNFSNRTTNSLRGFGIVTVGHLRNCSERDLRKIPNLGKVSIAEIKRSVQLASDDLPDEEHLKHRLAWIRDLLMRCIRELPSDSDLVHECKHAIFRIGDDL